MHCKLCALFHLKKSRQHARASSKDGSFCRNMSNSAGVKLSKSSDEALTGSWPQSDTRCCTKRLQLLGLALSATEKHSKLIDDIVICWKTDAALRLAKLKEASSKSFEVAESAWNAYRHRLNRHDCLGKIVEP